MKNYLIASIAALCLLLSSCSEKDKEATYDLVIYGATSGGIAAGIQASRMGKKAIIVSPTQHIGGLTTGGLGQTDIGNKVAIGGISREFYQNIKKHYEKPENWKWEERQAYKDGGQTRTKEGEDAMWTFEPSAALKVYQDMLAAENLEVVLDEQLKTNGGVQKEGTDIISITTESGAVYDGLMFIDATYEGDLFAAAGASYTVGREANSQYGETFNGIQLMEGHQFPDSVSPYKIPGDKSSGLVWGISEASLGQEGNGDNSVQAYNFRICLTDNPENRLPIIRPKNYDSTRYELLVRLFEAQPEKRNIEQYFIWSMMPNRKTDINNRGGFSTDMIGENFQYPEASWETRERIIQEHVDYTKGLLYFYATDPRVPAELQTEIKRWGYPKDEYPENGNWSPQLYVREARRLVGDYVMQQANCVGEAVAEDAVGLAAYTMDSHNCRRLVVDGQVKNEGNVEKAGFPPYPVAYRSLLPKKEQVSNLLVPVSLSATHIAFGSIRMEPVFMVLGQSAATAAVLAIEKQTPLHELDYQALKTKLLEDEQVLVYQKAEEQ